MLHYLLSAVGWILRKSIFVIIVSAFVLLAATVVLLAQSYFGQLQNEIIRLTDQERILAHMEQVESDIDLLKSEGERIELEMKQYAKESQKWLGIFSLLQKWGLQPGPNQQVEELARQSQEIADALARRHKEIDKLSDQLGQESANLQEARERNQQRLSEATEEWESWTRRRDVVLQSLGHAWKIVGSGLVLFAALVFVGPFIGRVMQFFVLAPLMALAKPIQLTKREGSGPLRFTEGGKALSLLIQPQQSLQIHHEFLHGDSTTPEKSFEESQIRVRTRWILSWQYWFTCMAARLFGITEMTNQSSEPLRVTVSQSSDPNEEVSLLELPDKDSSVILLPSHLAGILCPNGQSPKLRSHWILGHLHAWIAGRFRYIEIFGPGTLILHGTRGLKWEEVGDSSSGQVGHWKNNRHVTVAFSPQLQLASRRAETFYAFLSGANPLFDQRFHGCGIIVTQQASTDRRTGLQRFFQSFWDGILRALGI